MKTKWKIVHLHVFPGGICLHCALTKYTHTIASNGMRDHKWLPSQKLKKVNILKGIKRATGDYADDSLQWWSNVMWIVKKRRIPTGFSGDLDEGLHTALSVVSLWGKCGHVVPLHGSDYVHHGLGLVGVGRYHAGEEVVTTVVTQFWCRWSVADLRDLDWGEKKKTVCRSFGSVYIPVTKPDLALVLGSKLSSQILNFSSRTLLIFYSKMRKKQTRNHRM